MQRSILRFSHPPCDSPADHGPLLALDDVAALGVHLRHAAHRLDRLEGVQDVPVAAEPSKLSFNYIISFYYPIIAEPLLVASGHAEAEGVDAVVLARQLGDLLLRRLGADLAPDEDEHDFELISWVSA